MGQRCLASRRSWQRWTKSGPRSETDLSRCSDDSPPTLLTPGLSCSPSNLLPCPPDLSVDAFVVNSVAIATEATMRLHSLLSELKPAKCVLAASSGLNYIGVTSRRSQTNLFQSY